MQRDDGRTYSDRGVGRARAIWFAGWRVAGLRDLALIGYSGLDSVSSKTSQTLAGL
jgi:hypothetical protein